MNKLGSLFRSRRFWATVLTSVFLPVAPALGVGAESANVIAGVVAAWIVGDSLNKTE